jgi:hypothetical protein
MLDLRLIMLPDVRNKSESDSLRLSIGPSVKDMSLASKRCCCYSAVDKVSQVNTATATCTRKPHMWHPLSLFYDNSFTAEAEPWEVAAFRLKSCFQYQPNDARLD